MNGVCDGDEKKPETNQTMLGVVTNATTSTTTTTQTSSTVTTTSSTSTTLSAWEKSNLLGCFDSDGGDTFDVRGETAGKKKNPPHTRVVETDSCINNVTVREYRCEGELVYVRAHLCESQEICLDGECCLYKGKPCKSSSDCCSNDCRKRLHARLCN